MLLILTIFLILSRYFFDTREVFSVAGVNNQLGFFEQKDYIILNYGNAYNFWYCGCSSFLDRAFCHV